jgi:glycosyltransferase involved in cell wall biosynthesis
VHLTSELEKRELEALDLPAQQGFVVPNGVDLVASPGAPAVDEPTVLYLGRINWKKGLDRLIEALKDVPRARLVIAGNDEEDLAPQLAALAQRLGVAQRVSLPGYVEGAAKQQLLAQARVLVLPSLSENFGNAALEALAHGCPVVLTAGVGLAEAVAQAGAGIVSEGDPAALARAIRALLDDEPRRRAAGAAALALVRERYGWPTVAAQMAAHYERLVREARRA